MMKHVTEQGPEPAWEVATLFPNQGDWTDADYCRLQTNRFVELSAGRIEVPPTPSESHQLIVLFLASALRRFANDRGIGKAVMGPLPVRLSANTIREPDIVFLRSENYRHRHGRYWTSADLIIEVVSEDDPARHYVKKRKDYASAGVSEYWIVDPEEGEIRVLKLVGKKYETHGVFRNGDRATSDLLEGFEVSVSEVFEAE